MILLINMRIQWKIKKGETITLEESSTPNYDCQYCELRAISNHQLQEHIRKEHEFECTICGKQIKDKTKSKKHTQREHTDEERFKCEDCRKECKGRMESTDHKKNQHSGDNEKYEKNVKHAILFLEHHENMVLCSYYKSIKKHVNLAQNVSSQEEIIEF